MTQQEYTKALSNYLPDGTAEILSKWIFQHEIKLSITRNRKTKLGDFRTSSKNKLLRISVNGDLNPYAFLITLVHEIAHALVHKKHGNRVKPHGLEWKSEYKQLMLIFFAHNIFPDDITRPLAAYMKNPKASSNADRKLFLALRAYDKNTDSITYLQDLDEGSEFILQKILFRKGKKRRTRYSCVNISNGREYTVNALAEVLPA